MLKLKRRRNFFSVYGIPTGQQPPDKEDVGSEYVNYSSRTQIGTRSDIIIALYGSVSPYTEWRYWWKDSIAKQTIALADRSGLRKKGTIPPDPTKQVKARSDKEIQNLLLSCGIGTDVVENEKDRAERIRQKINTKK